MLLLLSISRVVSKASFPFFLSFLLLTRVFSFIAREALRLLQQAASSMEPVLISNIMVFFLLFFGQTPSILAHKASEIFYTIVMNVAGFYATALLSSFLAEQVRRPKKTLKKKKLVLTTSKLSMKILCKALEVAFLP